MPQRLKAAAVILLVAIVASLALVQQRKQKAAEVAPASHVAQAPHAGAAPSAASDRANIASAAGAQPATWGVLREAPSPGLGAPAHALRHRWIAVEEDLFTAKNSPFWAAKDERRVVLNLFPDAVLQVKIDRAEVLGVGRYGAQGTIEGRSGSRVLFAMAGDSLSVAVFDPELGSFVVEGITPGNTIVYEIDPEFPLACAGGKRPFLDQDAIAALARRESAVGGPPSGTVPTVEAYEEGTPVIDVMVVYSQEVLSAAGLNNIISRIDLAIMEANSDFTRSDIAARLRLVHTALVNAQENGSFDTALDRLRRTDDGFMDGVHALRNQYGADLVSLVILNSNDSTVGQAYLLNEPWSLVNELFAFSVVQWSSLTGSSTFTHELGHNLGCAHSRHNASSPGAYGYSYGYKFNDAGGTLRRTIMAYTPGAQTRVFSNPRLRYPLSNPNGIPMGVPAGQSGEADNALTVDQSAFEVANYRLRADAFAEGHLINVSTRALVGSGFRQLIGGFVISGPPKTVIVRAVGPSLLPPPYNIANALLDPKLEIRPPSAPETLIAANDDWMQSPNAAALQATQWAPTDPREAAEILTLPAGDYTVMVSGKNDTTGIGLVEIYEQGRNGNKVINLSTRAWVDTDFNVMIGGFVIEGAPGETKRVLIRVLGPTLEDYQVPDALFDPAARLYNAAGELLLDNDDWDAGPHQEEITALGRAPGNRREPAMLIDIAPGAYTVIVRPFENPPPDGIQPGIGLIEVYEITTAP
ncbi:MAG TPA: M12 family metallo-peptidase [Opitutaceae bacterium]|nr:M12 family metallo-peptidase [Opitutaceae bacterium]